ncbi:DUF5707 domain-containing protein [Streptomyces polyrhachis]|uniref:DUF5707 domain-containing protein n=1 Tax=Streptomyces polyrhachis TaxID=1282885 RepID=A0ABW2GFB1_9ACTN
MKKAAFGAALVGALAVSALAVPSAGATDSPLKRDYTRPTAEASARVAPLDATAGTLDTVGDTQITDVTVHGGKSIDMGTTNLRTITVSMTATDDSGIDDAYIDLWHGADWASPDGLLVPNEDAATCTAVNATTATCKLTITIDPRVNLNNNLLAGTWKVTADAYAKDGDYSFNDAIKTTTIKRYSRLTTNASPEPVYKGKTITVSGFLSRASWESPWSYKGYGGKSVTLQYKRYGSAYSWTNVKTVTSATTGDLKTTVTAGYDGYYRYVFAGNSASTAITSTSDFIDVK